MRIATIILSMAVAVCAVLLVLRVHPATAMDPPTVFSHFECYNPSPPGPPPPPPRNVVNLKDQFQQYTTQVGPAVLFCTPVTKMLQPGVRGLPVPPPADHLTCYAITGPAVNRRIHALNQLQRLPLTVKDPALLCVPTHKILG